MRDDGHSQLGLLTRLFLRGLIDNDLISPHADRHQSLAVVAAGAISLAIMVTFLISADYLAAFIELPGTAAVRALSDRFLFIAASMTVAALAALIVWDGFDLGPRDAAILGPLPIRAPTIVRAKLAAALVFGAALAIALNAVPSVLYPTFLTLNMRGMSAPGLLRLIAGHAASVTAAALFGFFAMLAFRGVLRLALGEAGFRRVSNLFQSALVTGAVTALLVTPSVRADRLVDWMAGRPPRVAAPPLWYLGLNERIAGHIVADTPVVTPRRLRLAGFLARQDAAGRAQYRALRPHLPGLARSAAVSLPLAAVCAIGCFLWNNRRLADRSAAPTRRSPLTRLVHRIAERLTRGDPEAQAGFFLALQTMTRNPPHRTIIAISLAAGLTMPIVTLTTGGLQRVDAAALPVGLLAIQVMLLSALAVGFRYAVTVPVELASNWTIRLAWQGDDRRYLAGVKRAGLVAFVVVPSLVLLPLHIVLFGAATGMVHTLVGALFATALHDLLFLDYRKMPFACGYVPAQNPKLLWPSGLAAFLVVNYAFAIAARAAVQTPARSALLCALLGLAILAIKAADRAKRRERFDVDFDEGPTPAALRLGLFEELTR